MDRNRRIAALALSVGVALAGCGGGGKDGGVASLTGGSTTTTAAASGSTGQGTDQRDALLRYTRCLRKAGIDVADPTYGDAGGPGGGLSTQQSDDSDTPRSGAVIATPGGSISLPDPEDPAFKKADATCKPILEAARQDLPKPSAAEQAEARDHALAFAKCMRAHGIDMPDPTFGADGQISIQIPGPAGKDPRGGLSDAMQAAQRACQEEAPLPGPPGSGRVPDSAKAG